MNIKNDLNKSVEELLEELDIAIDDNYDDEYYDDEYYDDGFYNEESDFLNSFY